MYYLIPLAYMSLESSLIILSTVRKHYSEVVCSLMIIANEYRLYPWPLVVFLREISTHIFG